MNMKVTIDPLEKANSDLLTKGDKKIKDSHKTSEVVSPEDRVEISSAALDLRRMAETVQKMPDVDVQKVAQVKERIASGNYSVSGVQVAERMIEEEVVDTMT